MSCRLKMRVFFLIYAQKYSSIIEWYVRSWMCKKIWVLKQFASGLRKFQSLKCFWNASRQEIGDMVCFKFHLIYLHKPFTVNKAEGAELYFYFLLEGNSNFRNTKLVKVITYQKKSKQQRKCIVTALTESTDVFITAIDLTRDMILDRVIGE